LVLETIFYCLKFETSLFVTSYDSQGHGGGIRTRLHTDICPSPSTSPSHIATDGHSASKSWYQALSVKVKVKVTLRLTVSQSVSLGVVPRPDINYYRLTVTVLFLWGAFSDKRTGLSFIYAAGPCQRSLSRVRVPWDSRPYFTVSDLKLPFSSPPTTRMFSPVI
jgi:hypothetical protein